MALLLDEDYEYLKETGMRFEEDEPSRFLIFRDFPLPVGIFKSDNADITSVDVLCVIPPNYNTSGIDMFWVSHHLTLADGRQIPQVNPPGPGKDDRTHEGKKYGRWSRHWKEHQWKPKVDNVRTIIDRIKWAFAYPEAQRK